MLAARPGLVARGLAAGVSPKWRDGFELAKVVLELAESGLGRRVRNEDFPDERHYLAPIFELVRAKANPAEEALRRHEAGQSILDCCSDQ
jgi:gamma-glutamylcysteine synthetase